MLPFMSCAWSALLRTVELNLDRRLGRYVFLFAAVAGLNTANIIVTTCTVCDSEQTVETLNT